MDCITPIERERLINELMVNEKVILVMENLSSLSILWVGCFNLMKCN